MSHGLPIITRNKAGLRAQAQLAVGTLNLLELMDYLERHGWGYQITSAISPAGERYWAGKAWKADVISATGRMDSTESPVDALRQAFLHAVRLRVNRRRTLAQAGDTVAAGTAVMPALEAC